MQRITVTLINMYQWEPTLFDGLQLPSAVNKEDFITRLLIDSGEQEVTITHPEVMKRAIGAWSRGKLPAWNKILNIESLEYNPIWNVDGETTHKGSRSDSRDYTRDRGETEEKTGETSETTTAQLSADNSENWSNDNKTETSGTYEENRNLSEKITDGETGKGSDSWTEKRSGNIGVTTTQKMMNEEKAFWEDWDPVGYLIREFTREFCLLVF